ncbi:MAG: DJ-1 family glyoxalase III [Bacillota bacterium]
MAKIIVPLARGFEEIEAVTVIDILRRADIEVVVAGLTETDVMGAHGLIIQADQRFKNINWRVFDGIVLPGGMPGAENLRQDKNIISLVQEFDARDKLVAAICAAPIVLKGAGILDGKKLTSYPGFADEFVRYDYLEDPVVVDDNIITSRGPGTAMNFALTIIEYLLGNEEKIKQEENLLYNI